MKIVYIAHPVSGDIPGNLEKVRKIGRMINMTEPDTVPVCQFFFDCQTLDDSIPAERERGIKNDTELLRRGSIDELRPHGDRISKGMAAEIKLAEELNIPICPMTANTSEQYFTSSYKQVER